MSNLGDAMKRKIKALQGDQTPEQATAAEEAKKRAAEEAQKRLGYGKEAKADE